MQSNKEERDALDHTGSHTGLNNQGPLIPKEQVKEEWISEMPPHIKQKTEEWIDYFGKMQFRETEMKKKLNKLKSLFKIGSYKRINAKNIPKLIGLSVVTTFLLIYFFNNDSSLKWIGVSLASIVLIFVTLYIAKSKKYVIEYVDPPVDLFTQFDKHRFRIKAFKADGLKDSGSFADALEIYKLLSKEFQLAWIAKYQVGSCLMLLNRRQEALNHYRELIRELLKQGEFKERAYYISISYCQIGNIYESQAEYDNAHKYFQYSLDYQPQSRLIHSNMFYVCIKLRRFDEAKQWFIKLNKDGRNKTMALLSIDDLKILKALSWFPKTYPN